jgi:hypothetical protein
LQQTALPKKPQTLVVQRIEGRKKFATLLQQEAPKLPENTPKNRKQRGSFLPEKGKEKTSEPL